MWRECDRVPQFACERCFWIKILYMRAKSHHVAARSKRSLSGQGSGRKRRLWQAKGASPRACSKGPKRKPRGLYDNGQDHVCVSQKLCARVAFVISALRQSVHGTLHREISQGNLDCAAFIWPQQKPIAHQYGRDQQGECQVGSMP